MAAITANTNGVLSSFWSPKATDIKSLKVYFSPKQEGTGDPSPSNVRPITGWTGINVTRSGKNMLNKANSFADIYNYIAFARSSTIGADGSIKLQSGTYTFSASQIADMIVITDKKNATITRINNSDVATFSLSEDTEIGITFIKMNDSAETLLSYNYQLECGSVPTTFEPYVGNVFQADWTNQGTIYGGYVDLVNGSLVVTHGYRRFTGNDTWIMSGGISGHCAYRPTIVGVVSPFSDVNYKPVLSDKLKGAAVWAINEYEGTINKSGNFYFGVPEELSTSNAVNEWIEDIGGLEIVFPLTEPITYQLTPQQIKTLVGRNNIWSNADSVEVEYEYVESPELTLLKKRIVQNEPHLVTGNEQFVTDLKSPLKSLKVSFEPKQEGSGDPSPSNVRNVIEYTGTDVWKTGKNLAHFTGFSAQSTNDPYSTRSLTNSYGTTISTTSFSLPDTALTVTQANADSEIAINHYKNGYFVITVDSLEFEKYYYVSFKVSNIVSNPLNATLSNIKIANPRGTYAADPTIIGDDRLIFTTYRHRQNTSRLNESDICIYNCGMSCTFSEFMVTPVDEENQTFESYTGENIPISWSSLGTQYGGYVDLIKGELVAEYEMLSDTWGNWGNVTDCRDGTELRYKKFTNPVYGNSLNNHHVDCCNVAKYVYTNENGATHYYIVGNSYNCRIFLPSGTDTSLQIQAVGKLITPIHYSLTPQQILTLRGTNNIFSKDGSVETEYWTHTDTMPKKRTVVWNNMVNGYLSDTDWKDRNSSETSTTFSNGVATTTFTNTSGSYHTMITKVTPQIVLDNKYYVYGEIKTNVAVGSAGFEFAGGRQVTKSPTANTGEFGSYSFIQSGARTGGGGIYVPFFRPFNGQQTIPEGLIAETKNVLYVDLTLMFGAGNEPTTPEEFERLCALNGIDLSKPQPYDAGTSVSWLM